MFGPGSRVANWSSNIRQWRWLFADRVLGRGLTGMLERVRALSGTLQLLREEGRTCVRCRLPAGDPAAAVETKEA